MSAPMMSNSGSYKTAAKPIILSNAIMFIAIGSVAFIPFNHRSQFDIVANPLFSVKTIVSTILILHLLACLFQWKSDQKYKPNYILRETFRGIGIYFVSILFFHCVAVLFGAPFFEQTAETFHFAMMLSTTVVAPALIHFGTSPDTWLKVFVFHSVEAGTENMIYISCICSLLGAWLGAFPIPLDWDRSWQVWPITCVLGTVLGHCAGLLMSTLHLTLNHYRGNKHKLT